MSDILTTITTAAPQIISLLQTVKNAFGTPTAPAPTVSAARASAAIADLQALLNTMLALNPPLVVDGWLGPKTEAAIEAGIAKLKTLGIG